MRLIGLAAVLTVSLVPAPLAAEAEQAAKTYRIGFLGTTEADKSPVAVLRQGLRDLGCAEGSNLVIEYRWAGDNYDRTGHAEEGNR